MPPRLVKAERAGNVAEMAIRGEILASQSGHPHAQLSPGVAEQ